MDKKPKIFSDESADSSFGSVNNSTAGLGIENVSAGFSSVNPALEQKKEVFLSKLKPRVFGSLPVSINSFMNKYYEYLKIFETTISDENQRRETAILMARKEVPVNAEVLEEAESSFFSALKNGASEFQDAIEAKANKTIGAAKTRSETITERRNQISIEIRQLQSEDAGLSTEFEQLKSAAITIQNELSFSNSAFNAAYAAVESEGNNLLNELKRMLKQEVS